MKNLFKILGLAVVTIWGAVLVIPDGKVHVVMCDVGQGDALIVFRGTTQVVIDGGPNDSVLQCLARYLPIYDKRIEVVVSTHPQADHMNGLIEVAKRYNVMLFVMGPENNTSLGYKQLWNVIKQKNIPVKHVYSGDQINLGGMEFYSVWPSREYADAHVDSDKVLGLNSDGTDLNRFGIVLKLKFGQFKALFSADADSGVDLAEIMTGLLESVDVLKVPHHGSRTGMTDEWLEMVRPKLALISVGRKNSYGHPSGEVIKRLSDLGIKTLRTDLEGDIEVISDGKEWWVR